MSGPMRLLVLPLPRRLVGLPLGAADADERGRADRHARDRRAPDGDAVGGRRAAARRDAELRGAAGGQDHAAERARRLPSRRHDRHLRPRLVGGVRLARRDSRRDRVPAHQRDERPPADLRVGPRRSRRADAGREGLGDRRDDARGLASRGPGGTSNPPWRDRCGPRRPDRLPPVLGVPDARRDVPARRGGLAPAPRRGRRPRADPARRDRGRAIEVAHRRSAPADPADARLRRRPLGPPIRPRPGGLRGACRQPGDRAGRVRGRALVVGQRSSRTSRRAASARRPPWPTRFANSSGGGRLAHEFAHRRVPITSGPRALAR